MGGQVIGSGHHVGSGDRVRSSWGSGGRVRSS